MIKLSGGHMVHVSGKGLVYAVGLPYDIQLPGALNDKEVEIDGKKYTVIGTEFHAHAAPWKKGEMVGLVLRQRDAVS